MATRSIIGILHDNNTIESIYCHFDGYPSNTGYFLLTYYNTKQKVLDLISKGDLSSLASSFDWNEKELPKIDNKIQSVKDDANNLGLDIQLTSPVTGTLKQYSDYFPSLKKLADSVTQNVPLKTITYGGGSVLPAGKKSGGMISIFDLINRPIRKF